MVAAVIFFVYVKREAKELNSESEIEQNRGGEYLQNK